MSESEYKFFIYSVIFFVCDDVIAVGAGILMDRGRQIIAIGTGVRKTVVALLGIYAAFCVFLFGL